jgi:hypothetical protein
MKILRHMLPGATAHDTGDVGVVHAKVAGDSCLRLSSRKSLPDLPNVVLSDLSHWSWVPGSRTTAWFLPATLAVHIVRVLLRRPQEQVFRVDARWIITAVQHVHAVWNRPVRSNPGHAMRRLLTQPTLARVPGGELPISKRLAPARPNDAATISGGALINQLLTVMRSDVHRSPPFWAPLYIQEGTV